MYRPPKVRPKTSNWEVGIFMAKYSYEFKKEIVKAYLNGEGSQSCLAKEYGVSNKVIVKTWIDNYKAFGDKGLMRSRKKKEYSFEKKLSVVESYLSSEISYRDLAIKEGITNPSMIVTWVNRFRAAGPDALRPHKKGRRKTLGKDNSKYNKQTVETTKIDPSDEYVKELEDELLKLRIENAFLKELRRLRLEDEARTRDLLESSPASEDNSN